MNKVICPFCGSGMVELVGKIYKTESLFDRGLVSVMQDIPEELEFDEEKMATFVQCTMEITMCANCKEFFIV